MALEGKGFMIWRIERCEDGNAAAIATAARAAGLTNVLIKVANGTLPYNIDKKNNDLVPAVVQALRANGIQVWGWHYIYGANPAAEAQIAVKRVKQFALDGYIIDAEVEFKKPGMANAAKVFMGELRRSLPNTPVALSSFRFPSYHAQFPWREFLEGCNINMPQVYWEKAHNPAAQLQRCLKEFQAIAPYRPIIPTGPIYKGVGGWTATPGEILEFMDAAQALHMSSVNFFEWYYGRGILRPLWDAVAGYPWGDAPQPVDICLQYFNALNSHKINLVDLLYTPDAVLITAEKTLQGTAAIQEWHDNLFNKRMPSATFRLTGVSGGGDSRHFTWEADSAAGKVRDGSDTFGLQDGRIVYHYSFFSVS